MLPGLAASEGICLIHLTAGAPALLGNLPNVVSPTAFSEPGQVLEKVQGESGLAERLRRAAGWGGWARRPLLLWPSDLPAPDTEAPCRLLPAVVHPYFGKGEVETSQAQERFSVATGTDLPVDYVLYHGPTTEPDFRRLLSAWSWAAGPIGEFSPLVVVGGAGEYLERLLHEYNLAGSVQFTPELSMSNLVLLYQGCSLLFHPAHLPAWGDPLRMALACSKPVVALESPHSAAVVGPAAYLAPFDQSGRLLGAALISVILEESLSSSLKEQARQRAGTLDSQAFTKALNETYLAVL